MTSCDCWVYKDVQTKLGDDGDGNDDDNDDEPNDVVHDANDDESR